MGQSNKINFFPSFVHYTKMLPKNLIFNVLVEIIVDGHVLRQLVSNRGEVGSLTVEQKDACNRRKRKISRFKTRQRDSVVVVVSSNNGLEPQRL